MNVEIVRIVMRYSNTILVRYQIDQSSGGSKMNRRGQKRTVDFPYATLPYQFYGCEDPSPVKRRTGHIHVARVMSRRIFGLARQLLERLN